MGAGPRGSQNLVLAAKAIGAQIRFVTEGNGAGEAINYREHEVCEKRWEESPTHFGYTEWNPRDDDGDSRRLQVKLRIRAYYTDNAPPEMSLPRRCAVAITPDRQWFAVNAPDECEAMRLAVLQAAAEMGRAMP